MEEQELKELLEENKKLARENNKMLKRMRRGKRINTALKIIGLIVIVVLGYIGYQYAKPYFQQITEVYQSFSDGINEIQEVKKSLGDNR